MLVVYRPPPSAANESTINSFFDEFGTLLEQYITDPAQLLLAGDFNFHVDNASDKAAHDFLEILDSFNLKQHVRDVTHMAGHTLDLLITHNDSHLVKNISVHDPVLSDHCVVKCELSLTKPTFAKEEIRFRKLKSIDINCFRNDISTSSLIQSPSNDLNSLVAQYDSVLSSILDDHAPVKKHVVTIRPAAPWYTNDIKIEKRKRRSLERRWRVTRSPTDRVRYVQQCCVVKKLLSTSKSEFYSKLIADNQVDMKKLFSTISKLLHRKPDQQLPRHQSSHSLAQDFISFFGNKIRRIRDGLIQICPSVNQYPDEPMSECQLESFCIVTTDELSDIISLIPFKSCNLDPVPSRILRECLDLLLPVLTTIVNLSLESAMLPTSLKEALLLPILKKCFLDADQFSNFRPISNLRFVAKIVEKVVALQLIEYIDTNDLDEKFQSAYKKNHSTETALIRVHNDIVMAIDSHKTVILLLLDLSAAFDTVDHDILLHRLCKRFGIVGKALRWFRSYLSDRTQFIKINGSSSVHSTLDCGVPQGSVLGPLLYSLYTSPLGDIAREHDMNYHFYADDTQLYITYKSSSVEDMEINKCKLEACVSDINNWMLFNKLKLNKDKTELLVISSPFRPGPPVEVISVCDETVFCSTHVRNIGVLFDDHLSMVPHISATCKSAFFHLRNIARIRKYLTPETAKIVILAFITSKLDYCNSLLYGLPIYLIKRLQRVQNAAARLISLSSKYEHITPILIELHWLPLEYRIKFKILTVTYKALHNQAPDYIKELIHRYVPMRNLRSSKKYLLEKPTFRLNSYGSRAFCISAPELWNILPENIKISETLEIFKKKVKTFLFTRAFLT